MVSAPVWPAMVLLAAQIGHALPISRHFKLIPYGSTAPGCVTSISCDGRVPGATLELTHWPNNLTPDDLYADTSTEAALRLASSDAYGTLDEALVLNNHYDTDGVLSVFACLDPGSALRHADLLIAGAEAGDFGEWSSDAGVKLDLAVSAMDDEDEAAAYAAAQSSLAALLEDFASSGGRKHEHLWRDGWEHVLQGWAALEAGDATVTVSAPACGIALVSEAAGMRLPSAALDRALTTAGLSWRSLQRSPGATCCSRVLRATREPRGKALWAYEYAKPGHGWCDRLRTRPIVSTVGLTSLEEEKSLGRAALAAALNARFEKAGAEACWAKGGSSGLVALCHTAGQYIPIPPEMVAEALAELDAGAAPDRVEAAAGGQQDAASMARPPPPPRPPPRPLRTRRPPPTMRLWQGAQRVRAAHEEEASVEVRSAGDKGLGAFAAAPISEGAWVCAYEGELVADGSGGSPSAFDPLGLLPAPVDAASLAEAGVPRAEPTSDCLLQVAPGLCLDGAQSTHFSRYFNHDEHGNLDLEVDAVARRADFFAAAPIAAGDELTFDYGESYWLADLGAASGPAVPEEGTDSRVTQFRQALDAERPFEDWYERRRSRQ